MEVTLAPMGDLVVRLGLHVGKVGFGHLGHSGHPALAWCVAAILLASLVPSRGTYRNNHSVGRGAVRCFPFFLSVLAP